MSNRELAKSLIDQIPESKLVFIINILENIGEMSGLDLYPDFKPNAETIAAIEELENGGGTVFTGSTEDLFKQLMED